MTADVEARSRVPIPSTMRYLFSWIYLIRRPSGPRVRRPSGPREFFIDVHGASKPSRGGSGAPAPSAWRAFFIRASGWRRAPRAL
jgi:hypothetical protein